MKTVGYLLSIIGTFTLGVVLVRVTAAEGTAGAAVAIGTALVAGALALRWSHSQEAEKRGGE